MSIRHFFMIIFISSFWVACGSDKMASGNSGADAQKAFADSVNFTTIEWIDSVKDFGKVKEGPKVAVTFRFKNTGTKPLVITNVMAGCGCTVVEQPNEPIMPGKESAIKGEFDTKGRFGHNNKNITVQANTTPVQSYELKFSVEVEK